jgi:uncharacterized membrane protein
MNEAAKETVRLESFSDGVFAIAMTLLVLNLVVPTVAQLRASPDSQQSLQSYLLAPGLIRVYIAYVVSFLTVLVMWASHHTMFTIIYRSDERFLLLNGVLLLFITLVPFPTGLVANFFAQTPDGVTAIIVYAGTFFGIALFFNLVAWYAVASQRLILPGSTTSAFQRRVPLFMVGPVLYLGAIGLAFLSVYASAALLVGMTLFYAAPLLFAQSRNTTGTLHR